MSKAFSVFKYELINTLTRRSFLLTLILVPLIPALIVAILSMMNQGQREAIQEVISPEITRGLPDGYIDYSDLIKALPEGFPENMLIEYQDESKAKADILNGQLSTLYIIPLDYVTSGEITMIRKEPNPVTGFELTKIFEQVLTYNLLGADPEIFNKYMHKISYDYVNLEPKDEEREDSMLAFYLPYGITMLFYVLIMTSASFLLNNITKEKENRVIELLMSSIKPIDLFIGKILGLGVSGFIQLVVWLGAGLLILRLGGTTLSIPENLQFSPSLMLWGIIFFILGYGLYGSLMAGVGAMVPRVKEASQATFIMIIPMIIPLMFISALIQEPNSNISIGLSLFPLTAPTSMMTRLAAADVPIWQPLLSILLLAAATLLVIRSVAKLFRAQTLLTGQKFSTAAFLKALVGKAQ